MDDDRRAASEQRGRTSHTPVRGGGGTVHACAQSADRLPPVRTRTFQLGLWRWQCARRYMSTTAHHENDSGVGKFSTTAELGLDMFLTEKFSESF